MYEETVERIARMMAEDNGDPQHWGVYGLATGNETGFAEVLQHQSKAGFRFHRNG